MAWLRESDNTMTQDGIMRGYDFEDIQLLLRNERKFMQPKDFYGEMSTEEKLLLRKQLLLKVARKAIMDSVNDAMDMLAEYAEDLIKITAPREKVIDGEVKTLQGWFDSDADTFDEYVKEGDKVAVDIVNYFIDLLPPRSYELGFLQVGEPYDHVKEGARYSTFVYFYKDDDYKEVWKYKGNCLAGSCKKGTEIPRV